MGRLKLNRDPDLAHGSMLSTLKARVGELATIPTLPEAALKAMAELKNPNCSLVDLAEQVEVPVGPAGGQAAGERLEAVFDAALAGEPQRPSQGDVRGCPRVSR